MWCWRTQFSCRNVSEYVGEDRTLVQIISKIVRAIIAIGNVYDAIITL